MRRQYRVKRPNMQQRGVYRQKLRPRDLLRSTIEATTGLEIEAYQCYLACLQGGAPLRLHQRTLDDGHPRQKRCSATAVTEPTPQFSTVVSRNRPPGRSLKLLFNTRYSPDTNFRYRPSTTHHLKQEQQEGILHTQFDRRDFSSRMLTKSLLGQQRGRVGNAKTG